MKWLLRGGIGFVCISFFAAPCVIAEAPALILQAEMSSGELLDRLPLTATLTIRNVSDAPVSVRFSQRRAKSIENYSALVLENDQRSYRLTHIGGPLANMPVIPADIPLPSRSSIVVERVIPLMVRVPVIRTPGKPDQRYSFIAPGDYVGHFEIDAGAGRELTSNTFQLTILEPKGTDQEARDRVHERHGDFFVGRDQPRDENGYDGRMWQGKNNVSRFGELQKIMEDYPATPYAKWIRFWKLYHHGPLDDALQFARDHPTFPRSDNLMLRTAEKYFGRRQFTSARAVLNELEERFPNGDTRTMVPDLRERLKKKPS